ncbi:inner membrane protein YiaA [Leucobacter denitrificans]|uniref:YiaAB two helix domain-containing protein n=1 Tax=Leucobacter denitrificans TaxID=683042 RepID=A0A7G9S452_9MICO|nr:inner membrane protein YiaA [Leucobacter denitrificans]QNN62627.1 hypothetical protein H9L06_10380 [Leucobacter denitrificans]
MNDKQETPEKPTPAFIGASWVALFIGMATYFIGLYNSDLQLNEKGYYLAVFLFGLFAAISLQKTVRDKTDGLPVTNLYFGIAWFAVLSSLLLLAVGLWNAGNLLLSEKGFYGIAFAMSLFAAVAVQKNVRDLARFRVEGDAEESAELNASSSYLTSGHPSLGTPRPID